MYDVILLPTDGGEGTTRAEEHAIQLAAEHGAALRVLHVVNLGAIPPEVGADRIADALESAGDAAIADVVERAEAAGVEDVSGVVEHGSPHREILDYATGHDVSLIVMGTHGRTGLDRYLLGSVAERVVRLSETPVLTVRQTD